MSLLPVTGDQISTSVSLPSLAEQEDASSHVVIRERAVVKSSGIHSRCVRVTLKAH